MPLRRPLLALLSLLAVACGSKREQSIDSGITRLEFVSITDRPASDSLPEHVEVVAIPSKIGDRCAASNDSVVIQRLPSESGELPVLHFERPGLETNLRLFQSVKGGEFDLVRLEIATRGLFLLRMLARGQGGSISTIVEPQSFPGDPTERPPLEELRFQTLELDFAELSASEGTFNELVLHKPMATAPLVIRKIELVRRGERELPSVQEGFQFVDRPFLGAKGWRARPSGETDAPNRPDLLGDLVIESRPAVGLERGEVLGVELGRAPADGEFVFDAMLEAAGKKREGSAKISGQLELRLVDRAGQLMASESFAVAPQWGALRLSFSQLNLGSDRLAGSRIELSGTGETRVLLSCPRIERVKSGSADAAERELPRTVLLITSDTHRADHVGYSSPPGFVSTPNLDALKGQGLSFSDCYSQTNVTNPSHVALMTAFHPRDSGVVSNFSTLASEARTLAEEFAEAGYLTFASLSAPHLSASYSGLRQGFDRVAGPDRRHHEAQITVGVMEQWLRDVGEAPVFLWVHLFDAHFPYVPPSSLDRRYYPKDRDPTDPNRSLPPVEGDVIDFLKAEGITDPEFPLAQYRAEIDSLDEALGPLLATPRIAGGIVAFTADHGEALGERSIYCGHLGLYPATLHVPLVLRWPGGPRGVEVDAPVEMYDLGRTLLNLAQVTAPEFPGKDLSAEVGKASEVERSRFALAPHGASASLQEGDFLCVLHLKRRRPKLSALFHEVGMVELFDLAADPMAESDLVLTDLPRARRMRERILEWIEDESAPRFDRRRADLNEEEIRTLTDLGYTEENSESKERSGRFWNPGREDRNWAQSSWRRLFEEEGFTLEEFRSAMDR